jgi:2-methylisocitrate lyase-like PEP mutase family enzyme
MLTQAAKSEAFAALPAREGAFIIPNPWDTGTARLLATMGFEALATTSGSYAFSAGRPDNTITRDDTIAHAAAIASATDLPVSADLNRHGTAEESLSSTPRRRLTIVASLD